MCRDGFNCYRIAHRCGGGLDCNDGSDESDTYSQCNYCKEEGYEPCPGFPGNCGKLCDGVPTCPDKWDELLSTCKSHQSNKIDAAICSEQDNLFQCKDGSMCLSKGSESELDQVCDGIKDCADGSDEDSEACKDRCSQLSPFFRHNCDNGSCIHIGLVCTAQSQPLCKDGSDMDFSLCRGKCYNVFTSRERDFATLPGPGREDPYRWPCTSGIKKCILDAYRCDQVPDCDDGSDERDCPFVTQTGLGETLLLCLATIAVLWLIFFSLSANSLEHDQSSSNLYPVSNEKNEVIPSFLLHPALSDFENQCWNWQEIGEQLRLEMVFFNKDPLALLGFLFHIEVQNAHPNNVHTAFKGFFNYLTSKGYDPHTVAIRMKQTIGHHRLAHMALRGPPNFIDRKVFEIGMWLVKLETKGKVYQFLLSSLRIIKTSISPFFMNFDILKDIILYLMLNETVKRIEENCNQISLDCLAASGTEKDILKALLVTFCVSIALTSIDSFFLRKRFFKTNFLLDLIFAVLAPGLPAIYHFRLSQIRFKLQKQRSNLGNDVLIKKISQIEKLSNTVQSTRVIEVGFEAIMQIFLLLGLLCFYFYTFKAPSGQTYSYFFGVAIIELRGNLILYSVSVFFSFLGPCWFYVNQTNILQHGSLNMSRKLVLMARNVLFLLVRVFAITSAIFIPVIKSWDSLIKNEGTDASSQLENWRIHLEFQKHFSKGLDRVTGEIRMNALICVLFLFIHFILVTGYGIFWSTKFSKGSLREQAIYLISTFSLPLPFLTIKGIDRGEEKAELWFLVVLHSLENFLIVLVSRLVYMQESYPRLFLIVDSVLFLVNILAVLVSVLYVTKLELYAGLPRDLPSSLPSYGPEVSFKCA